MNTKESKPRASSLISNLLNRVDGKSLAIKKNPSGGVVYYFESESVKHLKANKDSLKILSYEELEHLLTMADLVRTQFTMAMFVLEEHLPERKTETIRHNGSVLVRNIKEVDKIGSSKFAEEKSGVKSTKVKSPRKRI